MQKSYDQAFGVVLQTLRLNEHSDIDDWLLLKQRGNSSQHLSKNQTMKFLKIIIILLYYQNLVTNPYRKYTWGNIIINTVF